MQSGTTVDDARSKGYLALQTVRQSDLADGAVTSFGAVSGQVVTQNLYNGAYKDLFFATATNGQVYCLDPAAAALGQSANVLKMVFGAAVKAVCYGSAAVLVAVGAAALLAI